MSAECKESTSNAVWGTNTRIEEKRGWIVGWPCPQPPTSSYHSWWCWAACREWIETKALRTDHGWSKQLRVHDGLNTNGIVYSTLTVPGLTQNCRELASHRGGPGAAVEGVIHLFCQSLVSVSDCSVTATGCLVGRVPSWSASISQQRLLNIVQGARARQVPDRRRPPTAEEPHHC